MGFDDKPEYSLAAAATFVALCSVVVPLRFYARFTRASKFGWDDWLTIPALFMVIGCAVTIILGVRLRVLGYRMPAPGNSGNPNESLSYNFTVAEQLEWAFFLMQIPSMGFVKLSFVFFFRRIFVKGVCKTRFRPISVAAVVIITLWTLTFFLWFFFSCRTDFAARWTTVKTLHAGCSTDIPSDFAMAITDMITDIIVLAMPIPLVLRLNMQLKRKLAILAIFGLGTLTVMASVVRFALFTWILRPAGTVQSNGADENLLITRAMYWSMIESGLALIACCLPVLSSLTGFFTTDSKTQLASPPMWQRIFKRTNSKPPTLGISDSMLQVSHFGISKDLDNSQISSRASEHLSTVPTNSETTSQGTRRTETDLDGVPGRHTFEQSIV